MNTTDRTTAIRRNAEVFEAPELRLIGDAKAIIQGFFGTGWDGPYGMTEPNFEFEADADQE